MKRVFVLSLIFSGVLFLAVPAFSDPAQLVASSDSPIPTAPLELLEVTGMLEGIVPGKRGEVVTLNVYGKLASGPLSSDCRFLDERGAAMEKNAFLQRYMKRVVTLELEADSGAVVLFRVGS